MIREIIKILKKKKFTLAISESCTGGMLSSIFTSINGASEIFSMGLVTYSNESKIKILSVPKTVIIKYGAVSKNCCISMVKNLKKISKSNVCISVTGIAGPGGGSKTKPVGLVYVGILFNTKLILKKYNFNKKNNRILIQKKTCKNILKLLKKNLNN